jgi:hypothetical protein
MEHSTVVGGSTAKRVINCPGSVALCDKTPKPPSSSFADVGTLLHNAMDIILSGDPMLDPRRVIGNTYESEVLTEELYDTKIAVALAALEEIDPNGDLEFDTETKVGYKGLIEGAFGTTDLIGKIGRRGISLDWKFGDGVMVEAEESEQGMFYFGAAMHQGHWATKDIDEVEIIIVQPPHVRRWVTTPARIQRFVDELAQAVKVAQQPDAPIKHGSHCRWCHAKPVCPKMNGAVDRALKVQLEGLDRPTIGAYLKNAELLEDWITALRGLAFQMLEAGVEVPGYKLVAKKATRKWIDAEKAASALLDAGVQAYVSEVISPAVAEKALKKVKKVLPEELVTKVSSGSTLVAESDPRPAVVQIGKQLTAALSKIV